MQDETRSEKNYQDKPSDDFNINTVKKQKCRRQGKVMEMTETLL